MNHDSRLDEMINRLIASTSNEESRAIYADWAASYDDDLDRYGYVAPALGTALLETALPHKSGPILDAGCGTGLVGQHLTQAGYQLIDGTDYSPEMLHKAAESGHYRNLFQSNFSTNLDIPDNSYAAAICIGVYSSNFKETLIPEMARIVQPGGVICISCRPHYFETEFHPQILTHEAAGILTIEVVEEKWYMLGQQANAYYVVMRTALE